MIYFCLAVLCPFCPFGHLLHCHRRVAKSSGLLEFWFQFNFAPSFCPFTGGVAVKLDSPGYIALEAAIAHVRGASNPFAVTGGLPCIRELQDEGFDVQVCGFGSSEACKPWLCASTLEWHCGMGTMELALWLNLWGGRMDEARDESMGCHWWSAGSLLCWLLISSCFRSSRISCLVLVLIDSWALAFVVYTDHAKDEFASIKDLMQGAEILGRVISTLNANLWAICYIFWDPDDNMFNTILRPVMARDSEGTSQNTFCKQTSRWKMVRMCGFLALCKNVCENPSVAMKG